MIRHQTIMNSGYEIMTRQEVKGGDNVLLIKQQQQQHQQKPKKKHLYIYFNS